jgi:hypothetical protein
MSDSNLKDFYAELDARMDMPDDENWHNFSGRRRKYCKMPLLDQYPKLILVSAWMAPLALRSTTKFAWNPRLL